MDQMRPAEVEAVIKFARAGLTALSERALTWTGLAGCMAAFGYAAYEPDWVRVAAACAFAVLCFWPLLKLESSKKE